VNHKSMIFIGIIAAHGTVAAHWVGQDAWSVRNVSECHPAELPWPDLTPPRIMVASLSAAVHTDRTWLGAQASQSLLCVWSLNHAAL
jgi:hypothetical protein